MEKKKDYTYLTEWQKKRTKLYSVRLNDNVDQDLIEEIEKHDSFPQYVRQLIRADIEKQKRAAKRAKKAEE